MEKQEQVVRAKIFLRVSIVLPPCLILLICILDYLVLDFLDSAPRYSVIIFYSLLSASYIIGLCGIIIDKHIMTIKIIRLFFFLFYTPYIWLS